jgi:hypothetical protein
VTGEDPVGGPAADNSSDDEQIWRDLVARFDAPEPVDVDGDGNGLDGGSTPWPEREDLVPAPRPTQARTLPPAQSVNGPSVSGPRDWPAPASQDDDHFVPPPPPPLPKIDPITKGAWLALFGGPAYLLIATALGWAIPGIAAFCAVAAFVGGFAVLVLRMDDGPPRDSGPDDGAVV